MQTSKLQEVLIAMADNLRGYPNINREAFTTLERELQQSWNYTYGLKSVYSDRNYVFNGWGSAPDGLVVELIVLAVHGTMLSSTVKNDGPQSKNEIILLNKSWVPPEANDLQNTSKTITMTLNTQKNRNKKVTMNKDTFMRAPGVFIVNEPLIEEITDIWQGITNPISSSPILTYKYEKKK